MDTLGKLDTAYSYNTLCNTNGIALCSSRSESFASGGYYASKATGMQIQVERIDLRFPLNLLVRGVEVIQQPDTLLSLESLNVRVQAWPLIKGKVEVDEVTLSRVAVNSADLMEGMKIKGVLGRFCKVMASICLMN